MDRHFLLLGSSFPDQDQLGAPHLLHWQVGSFTSSATWASLQFSEFSANHISTWPAVCPGGFPGCLVVKNLPANVGDASSSPWVMEYPLEKEMTTAPVFLPQEIHVQRAGQLHCVRSQSRKQQQLCPTSHMISRGC